MNPVLRTGLLFSVNAMTLSSYAISQEKSLFGFTKEQTQTQSKLEERFDSYLNPDNLRSWMKRITLQPQHLGSPYRKENSEFIASQFKSVEL